MKKFLLVCFSLCFVLSAWAQERVITGRVTSQDDGSSLPGVNVVVKGTTSGTVTDADGKYSLTVPSSSASLVYSFIGLTTTEIVVGERSVVDVQLSLDVQQLSEVVVTALGIQSDKRALGYATSTVSNELIRQRPESDVSRLLSGKVPGVQITASGGTAGQGTNIIIRGYSTISGDKQPLWVVDGVPINSNTNSQGDFLNGGQSAVSRFADIDPNNIESMNVLKGLAAAVLYGQQGANGVIIVTTKNGSKAKERKPEISLQQSYYVNEIASLPDLQQNYGNGFNQNFGYFFSNWGPRFPQPGVPGVYGPTEIDHPYSIFNDPTLLAAFPEFQGKKIPYAPFDNNKFFKKGSIANTSVTLSGGTDKISYNATVSRSKTDGFIENNFDERINFGLGVNAEVTSKFSISTSVNFTDREVKSPPISAGNGSGAAGLPSIYGDVFYTPRNVDLMGLPFEAPDGRSVYYRSGNDIQNPRWTQKYASTSDKTTRFFGRSIFTYKFTKDFNLQYRVGLDTYSEAQAFAINKGGPSLLNGQYQTTNINSTLWNHEVIASYATKLTQDINLTALVGGQLRIDKLNQDGLNSTNQVVFGFMNHSNFLFHSPIGYFGNQLEYQQSTNYGGIYGQVTADYKDYLYLTFQGRNDWSSTVEKANNSIFYPSASVSFVPTSAFGIESEVLNYLKIRAGYGTSAKFPTPYSTRSVLASNARAFQDASGNIVTTNSVSFFLGNANLKPELQEEIEVGLEAKLLNNRLSFDLSMYNRNTTDLITNAPLDPATGYTLTSVNVGKINNKGIELSVTGTPLKTDQFQWDITGNYSAYRSVVESLGLGLSQVQIPGGGYSNLGNFAVPGRPFNVIKGSYVQRDANGNRLVDNNGNYIPSGDIREIGNPIPDFTSSLINTFSYKGISLFVQVDYRHGGSIYSTTASTLLARGITEDTGFDRSKTFILPGVKSDGTPNDIQITPSDYYFTNIGFGPSELQIFDGTTIRLQEVRLSYSIPKSILSKTPFKAIEVSFSGQNLWYNAVNFPKHVNFDTNQVGTGVGNAFGFDFLTNASSRRYGANLNIKF